MDRFSRNGHKPLCNWKCEKETRKYSHTLLKKKKIIKQVTKRMITIMEDEKNVLFKI